MPEIIQKGVSVFHNFLQLRQYFKIFKMSKIVHGNTTIMSKLRLNKSYFEGHILGV